MCGVIELESAKQQEEVLYTTHKQIDEKHQDARGEETRTTSEAANGALLLVPVTLEEVRSREIEL